MQRDRLLGAGCRGIGGRRPVDVSGGSGANVTGASLTDPRACSSEVVAAEPGAASDPARDIGFWEFVAYRRGPGRRA